MEKIKSLWSSSPLIVKIVIVVVAIFAIFMAGKVTGQFLASIINGLLFDGKMQVQLRQMKVLQNVQKQIPQSLKYGGFKGGFKKNFKKNKKKSAISMLFEFSLLNLQAQNWGHFLTANKTNCNIKK